MNNSNDKHQTDNDALDKAMQDVNPIQQNINKKTYAKIQKTKPTSHTESPPTENKYCDLGDGYNYGQPEHAYAEDILYFDSGGLHNRLKKAKQGKIHIDAKLDLHGHNVDNAWHEVQHMLEIAQTNDWRHILMIHGKGSSDKPATLKTMLKQNLPSIPNVLGFCSAPKNMGGSGALIVLLKSKDKAIL